MIHFFFIALGTALVAATLPVAIELATLTAAFFLPRRRRSPASAGRQPALAVLAPAHDEEMLIARTVSSLRSSGGPETRIVVVAHNCSDRTAERAREAGAEVLVYDDSAARGKGFALRKGFEFVFSQGADAALVIDADSVVTGNLVPAVGQAFARGARAVQCRDETICGEAGPFKTRLASLAFRGFNYVRPRGRARLGLSSGLLGNGFAISKEVFDLAPYRALSVVEDLEYHIHLVMADQRVEFLEEASVLTHLPVTRAGENSQRSRWEGGRILAARQWFLPLTARVLRGQLRLVEPLINLVNLPLAFAVCLLLLGLALPVEWARIYSASVLVIVGFHVLVAAWAGEDFLKELLLLCAAPAYILWKVGLLPSMLRGSTADAAWVRTERAEIAPKS